jgi:hypothetical protein
MRRFSALLWRVLVESLRGGAFPFLVGALILCGFSFYISLPASFFESGSLPTVSLAVVNADKSGTGNMLFGMVRNLPEVEKAVLCDEAEAERLLETGEVSVILKIPDGMVDSLIYKRPTEIQVKSADPLRGAAVYSMASAAADTVNLMQTSVYAYNDLPRFMFADEGQFHAAYADFCTDLIKDAVSYRRFVDTDSSSPDPYQSQFLALLVFLLCSGGALGASLSAARQISKGELRRFFGRDLRFGCFFAAKLAMSLILSLALCAVLTILMSRAGFAANPLRFLLVATLTTLAIAPVYLCTAFILPNPQYAALLSLALLLLFLFAGGGFYPVYLMHAALTTGNPAYLCVRLCEWALGDDFPAKHAISYFAAAIAGAAVSRLLWARMRKTALMPSASRASDKRGPVNV